MIRVKLSNDIGHFKNLCYKLLVIIQTCCVMSCEDIDPFVF